MDMSVVTPWFPTVQSVDLLQLQTLVSPAPAAGNTNWFDPFFEV